MIYAISDLHLSFSKNKPMDVFGDNWKNHYKKIQIDWEKKVKENDLVLLPGDISWALTLKDVKKDMDFLARLPGRKVLIKGNHDYWWNSLTKVYNSFSNKGIYFLQNNAIYYKDIAICGARGWTCPNSKDFTLEDEKQYEREIERLRVSLDITQDSKDKIVMMHYPPMNEYLEPSGFTDLFYKYNVKYVIYGHVHGKENFKYAPNGIINNINYQLVSSDFLNFKLIKLR